jgi:hypothetical protein
MKKIFFLAFASVIINFSFAQNKNPAIAADDYSPQQVMIRLCVLSYISDTMNVITYAVQDSLGMNVVWGPVEHKDIFGVSYSLMFVAKHPHKKDYTVVIRGTNFESLRSWIDEDFQVHCAKKFRKFVRSAPKGAKIAKGTSTGLKYLLSLKDEGRDGAVLDYLQHVLKENGIENLNVTGHSLGGTLTPPLYTYLYNKLFGDKVPDGVNTHPYSFAGLTAGNLEFNDFFTSYLSKNSDSSWRYVNPLDIAPLCWGNYDSLGTVYKNWNLPYKGDETFLINYLFNRAAKNHYIQPQHGAHFLPVVFNSCATSWISQAMYQHHSPTYQALVDSFSRKSHR